MAEITPEFALRILEALLPRTGTPMLLSAPDPDDESRTISELHFKYTEEDYTRIIKKHAPQLGGIQWKDLKSAGLLSEAGDAIDFGKFADLARECPDYDRRIRAARDIGQEGGIRR